MRRWMRSEFWSILKFRNQKENPSKDIEKELPLKYERNEDNLISWEPSENNICVVSNSKR